MLAAHRWQSHRCTSEPASGQSFATLPITMTDRVRTLVDELTHLSPSEREEFEIAFFDQLDQEPLGDALAEEAVRRLREAREGGVRGALVDEYFDKLEARARAKSA